ncbi:hypothetical protein [Maritalea sp.]|uniref:hypothetical protein n=1 Tax=Maritalea sp. TaxID=2003361 RepID=UPI003EF7E6A1
MPKVEFVEDFDFSPAALNGTSTVAYRKGHIETVTAECWQAAKKVKKAKLAPKSKTGSDDEQSN